MRNAAPSNKQLERTVHGVACAALVRHYIVHTRRAGSRRAAAELRRYAET
jgi:hypothetical protein